MTHINRTKDDPSDFDIPRSSRDRAGSIGEELFLVHLRRQSFDIADEEGRTNPAAPLDDQGKKRKGSEEEEEEESDILTAPLEKLCPTTPVKKQKKAVEEEDKEVFKRVTRKMAKARNY